MLIASALQERTISIHEIGKILTNYHLVVKLYSNRCYIEYDIWKIECTVVDSFLLFLL